MDNKCSMNAHVATIKKKFAARVWILRHLKRAKLDTDKLVRVYCAMIRPCMEYMSAVMHSQLTKTQSLALERMQAIALKTIFGWHRSYRECREQSGLDSLNERRHRATLSFAKKCLTSERFRKWFPENTESQYNLRRRERYVVDFARHERLKKAPIHYMRRLLNDQELFEELDYVDLDN